MTTMRRFTSRGVTALPVVLFALLLTVSNGHRPAFAFTGGLSTSGLQVWHQASTGLDGISPEAGDQFGGESLRDIEDNPSRYLLDTMAAGDFNGDGREDLATGAPYEDIGSDTDAGMVLVLYSAGSGGLSSSGYQAINLGDGSLPQSAGHESFGGVLAVGDFNNDGYDDLVVSSGGGVSGVGIDTLYIFWGGAAGLSTSNFQTITEIGYPFFWEGSIAAGDLNGDGFDDLAVSNTNDAVRLYFGSVSGLANGGCPQSDTFGCPTQFTMEQLIDYWNLTNVGTKGSENAQPNFGKSLAIGDLNNDGYADLAIGAPGADAENDCVVVVVNISDCNEGGVFILYGNELIAQTHDSWVAGGEFISQEGPTSSDKNETGDAWGLSVAIGDISGDGYGDLVIGAPEEDNTGSVTVIYGDDTGLRDYFHRWTPSDVTGIGEQAAGRFGAYIAVGNFNGDQWDDIAIGVPNKDVNNSDGDKKSRAGMVAILYGAESGPVGTDAQVWDQDDFGGTSVEKDDQFGRGLAAGDFNGDGGSDLAVAAPGENLSSGDNDDDGMVVVLYGTGDTSAPVITPTITGTLGNNGWYTSDVTVSWIVEEPQSPATLSVSGCATRTIINDTAPTTFTCEASSAGGSASSSVTIKRDTTAPAIRLDSRTPANANGWNNTDVTLVWACVDATSDVLVAAPTGTLRVEGENLSATGVCTDLAGNQSTHLVSPIKIDKTDPVVTTATSTPANSNGWNNTPVTVEWTCADALSGPVKEADSYTLNQEGVNLGIAPSCTDLAGNVGTGPHRTFNIDLTPPVASHDGPYVADEGTAIQLDGSSSSDALSGVASVDWAVDGDNTFDDGNPASFTPPNGPASYPVRLRVGDMAGNVTIVATTVTANNVAPAIDTFNLAPNPSGEGAQVTAVVDFSDSGALDTHVCSIDWGDGTGKTSGAVLGHQCTATHTYADNHAPGAPYSVTATLSDNDGDQDSATISQTVENVPPAFSAPLVAPQTSNEGDAVSLTANFSDPGFLDTHTCLIDWGDGNTETFAASALDGCSATHVYVDDNPSNTSSDSYTIAITVTDKDGDSDQTSVIQTVNNVAPSIDAFNVPATVAYGQLVTVSVDASDPGGADDPLTYEFDCNGDGVFEINAGGTNSYSCFPDQSTLSPSINVRVSDDDLGVSIMEVELYTEKTYCASRSTGRLRDASECNTGEMAVVLRPNVMTTFCASRTTGALHYSSSAQCASGWLSLQVPAAAEITVCESIYSRLLSYRSTGCASNEIARKIPAA